MSYRRKIKTQGGGKKSEKVTARKRNRKEKGEMEWGKKGSYR